MCKLSKLKKNIIFSLHNSDLNYLYGKTINYRKSKGKYGFVILNVWLPFCILKVY